MNLSQKDWFWIALGAVVVALWWRQRQAEAAKIPPVLTPTRPGAVFKSLSGLADSSLCSLPFVGGLLDCVQVPV